ncbi:MAG TPA: Lrp/AsnC family transcriptional regulator [Candidatus Altiarchaeales archaeon]|nr:Lrp/AsnC family transcriptional regulator [Candidatus Altiarchaeales archaeon]
MDEIKLLELLQKDGGLSGRELASMLDSSVKEVDAALKSLRKRKVLKGCKHVVDWRRVKQNHVGAIIQVKVVPEEQMGFDKICREISRDDRVLDVFIVTGEYDIMLIVEADSMEEVSDFVTEKLAPKKQVVGTSTQIILNTFKREGFSFKVDKEKRLKASL